MAGLMSVDKDKSDDKSGLNSPDLNTTKGGEDHEQEVSEPHRKAKQEHQTDHNYTVKQADDEGTALDTGRRRLSHRNPYESENAKKKREQEQALFRTALQQLQDRLNEIFEEIAAINERLQEIAMEMEEMEYLKDLAEKGLLDPKNPDHATLLKKYGITQDDLESGRILLLLNEQLGYRIDERTALEKRRGLFTGTSQGSHF